MSEKITSYSSEFNKKRKKAALAGAALTLGVGLSSFLSGCGAGNVGAVESDPVSSSASAEGTNSSNDAYSSMVESSNSEQQTDSTEQLGALKDYPDLDQMKDSDIEIPYNDDAKVVAKAFTDRLNTMIHVGVNESLAENVKKDPNYISKLVKQTDEKFLKDFSDGEPMDNLVIGWYDMFHTANLYTRLEKKRLQDLSVSSDRFPDVRTIGAPDMYLDQGKYGEDALRVNMIIKTNGLEGADNHFETNDGKKDVETVLTNLQGAYDYDLIYRPNHENKKLAVIEDLKYSAEADPLAE